MNLTPIFEYPIREAEVNVIHGIASMIRTCPDIRDWFSEEDMQILLILSDNLYAKQGEICQK